MIILSLGKPGSGKTLSELCKILNYDGNRTIYTNILLTKPKSNVKVLKRSMIVKKELIKSIQKKDGSVEEKFNFSANFEFWKQNKEPTKLVIDESALFYKSRSAMSKFNIAFNDWLYLIRRVFGDGAEEEGDLVLMTQVGRSVDVIAREMADQIRYHRRYFIKRCLKCGLKFLSHNDDFKGMYSTCTSCGSSLVHRKLIEIRIFHFSDIDQFDIWLTTNGKEAEPSLISTIKNPSKFFTEYNTQQFDKLIEDD